MKKKCSKCKELKDRQEFHGGTIRKSKCKTCTMDEYYAKKQEGFKARYVEGDTKIDICKCGNYYLNEVPRGNGACELRTKCRSCAMVINDLTYQRRVGEVVLREQVKVLRQENKVLETEVVKLRQLVANYQRKG